MSTDIKDRFRQAGQLGRETSISRKKAEETWRTQEDARANALAAQSLRVLRDLDRAEAKPVADAIRQAERTNGHKLMVSVGHGIAVTSRGLRVVRSKQRTVSDSPVWPIHGLLRINHGSVKKCLRFQDPISLCTNIRTSLAQNDLEENLVYAGADEWPAKWLTMPLYGVAASVSMLTLVGLPLVFIAPELADRKNNRAGQPMNGQ